MTKYDVTHFSRCSLGHHYYLSHVCIKDVSSFFRIDKFSTTLRVSNFILVLKVSKGAKIRNRYNQVHTKAYSDICQVYVTHLI